MRDVGAFGFLGSCILFLVTQCSSEPNRFVCRRKLRRHWRDICGSFNCSLSEDMDDNHPEWLSACNNAAIREQCCETPTEQPAAELLSIPLRDIGPMFLLPEELAENIDDPRTIVIPVTFTEPMRLRIQR